jgi:outer membrane protein TolC
VRQQLRTLDQRLAALERAASAAKESLGRGSSTLADYAPVDSNALTMRVEDIRLRSSLAQAQAALDLLLAPPF